MIVKCNNCGKQFKQNDFAAQSASILGLPLVCDDCSPTEGGSAIPNHIVIAAIDLCEYMPPNALAELVDYWADMPEYKQLAQIALVAGIKNCGLKQLASYIDKDHPTTIVEIWMECGIVIPIDKELI